MQTIDVERNGKRQETFPGYLKSSGFSRSALGSRLQPVFTMCKTHHRKSPSCKDNLASQSPETLADFPTTETHPGKDNLMNTFFLLHITLLELWLNQQGWALLGRFKKDILGQSNITFAHF